MFDYALDQEYCDRYVVRGMRWKAVPFFGIHNFRMLHSASLAHAEHLAGMLDPAQDQGLISEAEAILVDDIAMVIAGQDGDGEELYAVAEVSLNIEPGDVDRVLKVSEIIARALGVRVISAVISDRVADPVRQRADENGVIVAIIDSE